MARRQAATNPSGPSPISTIPATPNGRTTSRIEVDATGRPAARYSGVLVGLMYAVASLWAKGMMARSQPDRYAGSCR